MHHEILWMNLVLLLEHLSFTQKPLIETTSK